MTWPWHGDGVRRGLWAWLLFVILAAVPSAAVIAVALRAASAEEVRVREEETARRAEAARAVRRDVEDAVARAKDALLKLPEEGADAIARTTIGLEATRPRVADAVVIDSSGKLLVPEPPRAAPPDEPSCVRARDDLTGQQRADARQVILEQCKELRSETGRYLWPLLALEGDGPVSASVPEWIAAHGENIGETDRAILERRLLGSAASPARESALRELARARSSLHDTLAALVSSGSVDDEVEASGPVMVRRGRAISVLRALPGGVRAGYVLHEGSLVPGVALADDLRIARGPALEPGDATVTLAPNLSLHVGARDPSAAREAARRAGGRIAMIALGCVALSIALAASLFARARKAQRLAELRTDFVAAVSHELRTPLASVRMLAELLERGDVAPEERAEVETTLAGETRRLSSTLERMLRFGSLARGKLVVKPERTQVASLVEAAAERMRASTGTEVVVEIEGGEDDLVADLDEGLVGLALDNLLSNAAKYAPEGGPYRLGARLAGADLELSVSDRGPGLDRRAQRRIFLPFERADDRLSRATEGTGVGLAIVRGIARAHGGDATVESSPGRGARFTMRIPKEKPPCP